MASCFHLRYPLFAFAAAALLGSAAQAQFTIDNSGIPGGANNNSNTENVDFGDVDLDGDWDVVMADGGDDGNDQNRIWINRGGLQGGPIGDFLDQTASRFPVLSDDSRDIEFVDFDNDGDLDIYTSNTAQLSNQGNRWWTNDGGIQSGTLGFYTDETAARWVGLGGPGSSIPASQLIDGTFIDWSCDCDFGDLDNDGDLDLVHSSYGGAFGGEVPTRIFLNDGNGLFEEFNPSGFQLLISEIADGQPGLWCDGMQDEDTTNTNGANCDIASSALDIDLGDIDGDFDLDILHGARQEVPRMFANRLEASTLAPANGGALGFRDVTGMVFPAGYSIGDGHYEQEMGDLDGDGDLDIYGLNWRVQFGFEDITLRNDGDGTYSNMVTLSGSNADDNEGDFLDYDNDGDLDLYVANFSGQDKLYRNNNNGGSSFSYTLVSLPSFFATSLDADACDADGDGDYDVLVAEDNFAANTYLRNTTNTPDTHGPVIPNVETIGNQTAQADGIPVRAHVYDNAPYYITWFNDTDLVVSVDGCELPPIEAMSSAGQIFRGVLPGNLVGSIDYHFSSSDEYTNTGVSATQSYNGSTGISYQSLYGNGTLGSLGEPTITSPTVPFAGSDFYMIGGNAPVGVSYVMMLTDDDLVPGIQFGSLALVNVSGMFLSIEFGTTNADGCAVMHEKIPSDLLPGFNSYGQFFTLDGVVDTWAASKGLAITSQ